MGKWTLFPKGQHLEQWIQVARITAHLLQLYAILFIDFVFVVKEPFLTFRLHAE
jgi:hypothetical protein